MTLVALPAFADNYIWICHDGQQALVVDPGDGPTVQHWLDQQGLALTAILVTHHHADHIGGVASLLPRLQGPLFAPAEAKLPAPVTVVAGGERLTWAGHDISVLPVPGHTLGHLAYLMAMPDGEPARLFCGDTLFSGGCGRVFEGTPAQMNASLQVLAALPANTQICCAHEYTLSNLRFASEVDPDNAALASYVQQCTQVRAQGLPTLPSSLGLELQINPFLRCDQPALINAALGRGAASRQGDDVFAALREWKNSYR